MRLDAKRGSREGVARGPTPQPYATGLLSVPVKEKEEAVVGGDVKNDPLLRPRHRGNAFGDVPPVPARGCGWILKRRLA
jgi:hypothetical protein